MSLNQNIKKISTKNRGLFFLTFQCKIHEKKIFELSSEKYEKFNITVLSEVEGQSPLQNPLELSSEAAYNTYMVSTEYIKG